MSKRLQSVELELWGVSRTFEFDPAIKVDGEDEIEVGNELLSEVTSREVNLVSGGPSYGEVEVEFTITGTTRFELEDLAGADWSDNRDIEYAVASGDFYTVYDTIADAVRNGDADTQIDSVSVTALFDEDGEDFEF